MMGRTLVLVAHPDDETIGCGGLLQRMRKPIVVFATDGSPRDEYFWGKYGSREAYARLREDEARHALSLVEDVEVNFLGTEIPDQELYLNLDRAFARIAEVVERTRPESIITPAYEGGHPDHDCCSMLAAQLAKEFKLPVWEFPLYNRDPSGNIRYQEFIQHCGDMVLGLMPEDVALKQRMLKAYASQQPFLQEFDLKVERFRPQPAYDYSRPPHAGKLNYEAWGWPITGEQVCVRHIGISTHAFVLHSRLVNG